jgi:hypothetical protein
LLLGVLIVSPDGVGRPMRSAPIELSQGTGAARTGLVLLTDQVKRIWICQEGGEKKRCQSEFSDLGGCDEKYCLA